MSLQFDADTELIDVGSDASIDNLATCTIFTILQRGETGSLGHIWTKNAARFFARFQDTDEITLFRDYSGGGSVNLNATSSNTFTSLTDWLAFFLVNNGTSAAPQIFFANLSTPTALAEVSYTTQTTPVGSLATDASATAYIGHNDSDTTRSFVGKIALFAFTLDPMTLGECQQALYRPSYILNHDCRIFMAPGYGGTGTQPDWSGNLNNGSVTGATVAEGAPIPPLFGRAGGWRGAIEAVAGAPSFVPQVRMY